MERFRCRPCVRACVRVWVWNVDSLSLSSLMQLCFLPYASPICFLSSLCFPITSSLFLLNKGKHAISHNGIFSSAVCPWVGKNGPPPTRVCACVHVRDEAQRGVKTWDGVSLVVLPELFSAWGSACERTPALDFAGGCRAECAVFLWARVLSCYVFAQCRNTRIAALLSLWACSLRENEDVQMCL